MIENSEWKEKRKQENVVQNKKEGGEFTKKDFFFFQSLGYLEKIFLEKVSDTKLENKRN